MIHISAIFFLKFIKSFVENQEKSLTIQHLFWIYETIACDRLAKYFNISIILNKKPDCIEAWKW